MAKALPVRGSRQIKGGKPHTAKKGTMGRLLKLLFTANKKLMIIVFVCLTLTAVTGVSSSVFLNMLMTQLDLGIKNGMASVLKDLIVIFVSMGCIYGVNILCSFIYTRVMAVVTQRFLHQIRTGVFNKMQSLPIRYFDTHKTGDIMSSYTNDTDAIRQLVSQSIPHLYSSIISVTTLLVIMFTTSIWLSLVIFLGVVFMFLITKFVGGNSAKYFMRQQRSLGDEEGYIQEMIQGQKVIKVFCHEEESKNGFDVKNDNLCKDATSAHTFANILMPIMGNIGNILYVLLAFTGGLLVALNVQNLTITGFDPLTTETGVFSLLLTTIAFLPISKQFTGQISQSSQQVNSIVLGLAGASRLFELLDEEPEADDGYVTLVRCNIDEKGTITETEERTGHWAWKHPHKAEGTITYTELKGDIQMFDVDFGYVPEKIVLHNITLYANPGQKIAFVGATGAGKTTITNLINRFYDIADGKIRYDGININKIKKADLRRSLGIVLQDTNLFTGTVMENIRYGRLSATDEECIEAAKLAYAHDFISRLPDGYNTMLTSDGANLSQGQRQLLSIARAAVKDAPVMILDEATSSIDTRTEALVQKGTDRLMEGRTVFVIAHRLSTVQNSNVIMVLAQGNIIERGSHQELIAKQGQYYQLYTGAFELE
ncbi:MAG: ABC transporter ATP-binding protein [Clostridiales bacterium]|nr:ABC transporter ATP-binding protein [Clostridiales bacterium]